MKLRDMPTLARRFRFENAPNDLYCLVTPKCWPSHGETTFGRPWLGYLPDGDRSKCRDEHAEGVLTLRIPSLDAEYVEAWMQFAEVQQEEERARALEILRRLTTWHGEREREKR